MRLPPKRVSLGGAAMSSYRTHREVAVDLQGPVTPPSVVKFSSPRCWQQKATAAGRWQTAGRRRRTMDGVRLKNK